MAGITKCASLFYYKVQWSVITKSDSFITTKCDKSYYKVGQTLLSDMILLKSKTIITKCDITVVYPIDEVNLGSRICVVCIQLCIRI